LAETKQIITLAIVTLFVAISGIALIEYIPSAFEGDIIVDRYVATYLTDGTLIEEYSYEIKKSNQYRMLYRIWEAPLLQGKLEQPYIEFLNSSSKKEMILYMKNFLGSTKVSEPYRNQTRTINTIKSLAELNEVGGFRSQRFDSGEYTINYVFKIHPPIEYDEEICHVNIKLANQHVKYRNVTLIIEDVGYIEEIYSHPPTLQMFREENKIIFRGSSEQDELLEIEMLLKNDIMNVLDGFPSRSDNVRDRTVQANIQYSAQYYGATALWQGTRIFSMILPFLFVLLYIAYGREKPFVVPKYLSTIPNEKRKPWLVNLVIKNDALDYDKDGFYATLLDLHLRKKIRIKRKNSGLITQILDDTDLDNYELRAVNFLRDLSQNGTIDTNEVEKLASELTSTRSEWPRLKQLQRELSYLTRTAEPDVAKEFVENGRMKIIPFIMISILLLVLSIFLGFIFTNVFMLLLTAAATSIILIVQSLIAFAFPSTLFGKWRGSSYREKLEWDAFKRMLSDLVQIKKYTPQDLSMWGKWLVYGTSLGVGDNVVKAMKDLGIKLEEINIASDIPLIIYPIMTASLPSQGGTGSGGFGGGFGAGGGFGGGGAGGR
jgi:uncharacterized membrane protein